MARRLSLHEPEPRETRIRDVAEERLLAYGYEIRCRGLKFENDVLHVAEKFTENKREKTLKLDLKRAYLPPNRLYPAVSTLNARPDLARIVVAVVDTYLIRQQNTKSTAQTAVNLARCVIRFLEYCWLNDIYHLKDVMPGQWEAFLAKFVEGGWPHVLELQRRAAKIDLRTLRLSRRAHKKGIVDYSCQSLLDAIGTNVANSHLHLEYKRGASTGVLRHARGAVQPSESVITQVISQLNNLADLPREMRAQSLAHVSPYQYAASVGIPTNRTKNFEPPQLAKLITEAYRWITVYGPLIVTLTNRVYTDLTEAEKEELDESRMLILLEAPETKELEQLLEVRITSVRRVGTWQIGIGLLGLVRALLSASFLLLGVFNGRRKDEVQSRSVGLYAEAFECLDRELGLYQSFFYCEKTTHEYQLFYVNEISFKSLVAIKQVSDIAWNHAERNGGTVQHGRNRKMFCMPPRGSEVTPIWYDYATDPGISLLMERAAGSKETVVPNAHMFRRAYAVVFHYRYENADLYALSQQLDHKDLGMTIHYLVDGPSRVLAHHAAALWGDGGESKKARAAQASGLAVEVRNYSKVKLNDDVLEILAGKVPVAGGFARLVQRFARKMYGRIKFDDADLQTAATEVAAVLVDRGHRVTPFSHGNCNAGPFRPSAGCAQEARLARERASPIVCGACPYHSAKAMHIQSIKDDLERQREHLARCPSSIRSNVDREALIATERLVAFYARSGEPIALPSGAAG